MVGGVLKLSENESDDFSTFIFSLPIRIESHMIYGDSYEIELNEGWAVKTINDKGDMEIIRK